MKLPDSEPLAADEYWVITDPWKQEWERGVQVPVNPDSLPEPAVTEIKQRPSFQRHEFKLSVPSVVWWFAGSNVRALTPMFAMFTGRKSMCVSAKTVISTLANTIWAVPSPERKTLARTTWTRATPLGCAPSTAKERAPALSHCTKISWRESSKSWRYELYFPYVVSLLLKYMRVGISFYSLYIYIDITIKRSAAYYRDNT